ncbi:MAG: nitroreductase family protein [Chloroflexi bacterium]|nr:nitroreductase family protein [Chloroflexota bacterium]
MKSFWEVLNERRSVRDYLPDTDVPPETITKLLSAAIRAPSAGNRQSWHFIVVREKRIKEALAHAALGQSFVARAPVVIVVCADPARSAARYGRRGAELYCLQETAAATEHILLAAVAEGLGACWVGAFDEAAAAKALQLPSHLRPVAIIPIGHPTTRERGPGRRPLAEVVSYIGER